MFKKYSKIKLLFNRKINLKHYKQKTYKMNKQL